MGIKIGVASKICVLFLLVEATLLSALQCKIFGYIPVWEQEKTLIKQMPSELTYKAENSCWLISSKEGKKAEVLNTYFVMVGAAAFFEYSDDCKYICLNKNVQNMNKTKEEILAMLKKIIV